MDNKKNQVKMFSINPIIKISGLIIILLSTMLSLFGNDIYFKIFPKNVLEYEIVEKNSFNNIDIYKIKISNRGNENNKNIRIYFDINKDNEVYINENIYFNIKKPKYLNDEKAGNKYDHIKEKESYYINFDNTKSAGFERFEDYYILNIQSLKINETLDIKVLKFNSSAYSLSFNIKVESDTIIAKNTTEPTFLDILIDEFIPFISIITFVILISVLVIYDLFVSDEYKIKEHEKTLNKLKAKIKKEKGEEIESKLKSEMKNE